MSAENTTIQSYFEDYLATLPAGHPHHNTSYEAWGFGDSPEMADELGALVLGGGKRGTASLAKIYEEEGEAIPQVGELSIILDGQGQPMCIIEVTNIDLVPFNQVGAEFAASEGEGDLSLAYWRQAHDDFFRRGAERFAWEFHEGMNVVCESFTVVYPPEVAD